MKCSSAIFLAPKGHEVEVILSPFMWILVGLVLLVGEWQSMSLFLLYAGVVAFIVAIMSWRGVTLSGQLISFVGLSLVLTVIIRPRMLQMISGHLPTSLLTNHGAMMNRVGIAEKPITTSDGLVQFGNGEFWTARVDEYQVPIEAGSRVRVLYVDRLTIYVEPVGDLGSRTNDMLLNDVQEKDISE